MKNTGLSVWTALVVGVCLSVTAQAQKAYLDESLTAAELVHQAELLLEQDRPGDALDALDRVMAEYPDKLLPVGDGLYADATRRVTAMVLKDKELLAVYRTRNEAVAQRALGEALAQSNRLAALELLRRRYALTRTGLDASLLLAGMYLERGDAQPAVAVLADLGSHPDIQQRLADLHRHRAVAALMLDDPAGYEDARLALIEAGGDASVLEPFRPSGSTDQPGTEPTPDAVLPARDKPLWSERYGRKAPQARRPNMPQHLQHARGGMRLSGMTALPSLTETRLLLNSGYAVEAFDPDSGRPLWRTGLKEAQNNPAVQRQMQYRQGGDLRGVATTERYGYAVLGQPVTGRIVYRTENQPIPSTLIAFRLEDGVASWRLEPKQIEGNGMASALFVGTPVANGDRVYAMLSRTQGSNARDHFIVCVDAEDGQPLWSRHVSGSNVSRRMPTNSSEPAILLEQDRLYISDGRSVASCLDARTGSVRWARLFESEEPDASRTRVVRPTTPNDGLGRPVLVEAGLVVPAGPIGASAALLNPETGELKGPLKGSAWPAGAQFLKYDGDLIVISGKVTRFNGRNLKSRWSVGSNSDQSKQLMGTAALVGDVLLMPTGSGVQKVSLKDGASKGWVPSIKAAHLAVSGGMVVAVDRERLHGIDDWPRVRDRLTARAEHKTDDPMPGLALTHLALRVKDDKAALLGVDQALLALDERAFRHPELSGDALEQRVFKQLLAYAGPGFGGSKGLRSDLFDRIATMTSGPAQEVAYHLAMGAFRSESESAAYAEAVDHYQSILSSPELADQLYTGKTYTRHAGLEARRRIDALVREHGPEVYARYDQQALAEVDRLLENGAKPDDLIALASRYPMSRAAASAHYQAAVLLATDPNPTAAVSQFRLAYKHATDEALRSSAASELALLYEQQGYTGRARRWLARVQREYPTLVLQREGQAVTTESWQADLLGLPDRAERLPRMGAEVSSGIRLEGKLVPRVPQTGLAADRFLVIDGDTMRLYAHAEQPPLWEKPAPSPDVLALDASSEQVLLWTPSTGELAAYDGTTGQPAWPSRRAAALLQEITDEDRLPDDHQPQHDVIQMIQANNRNVRVVHGRPNPPAQRNGKRLQVLAGESVVCIAGENGRVVGVDRHTGTVLWRLRGPFDMLDRITLGEDAVAIAGRIGAAAQDHAGRLVVLDLVTGQPRMPIIHLGRESPRWAAFSGKSKLILVTDGSALAYDLTNGRVAWRLNAGRDFRPTGEGWAGPDQVILPDTFGISHIIDPDTGRVRNKLSAQGRSRSSPIDVRMVQGRGYLLATGSMTATDKQGVTRWQDALEPDQRWFVRQLIGDQHMALLSAIPPRPEDKDRRHDHRLFILEREGGRIVNEHKLDFQTRLVPKRTELIDDQIVVGFDDHVLVLPVPQD